MVVITKWKLDDLREHPRQREIFPDLTEADLQELARDIEANGLREAVEITAKGIIIAGHQRVRAAKTLDWTEIDVVVRSDLEAQGEAAVVQHLIQSNLNRRQLDLVERARAINELYELHATDVKLSNEVGKGDLRDQIGARLGVAGRTLDRYRKMLRTPREVQDAVSQRHIPIVLAIRVADLRLAVQAEIAAAIRAGGDPKRIVTEHFAKREKTLHKACRDYRLQMNQLEKIVKAFPPINRLRDTLSSERHVGVLTGAKKLIDSLLLWEQAARERN